MELKDTIEMMNSDDYKERLKAEYWQTKIRCEKLEATLLKYTHGTLEFKLNGLAYYLLTLQVNSLYLHLDVLQRRAKLEGIELEDVPCN